MNGLVRQDAHQHYPLAGPPPRPSSQHILNHEETRYMGDFFAGFDRPDAVMNEQHSVAAFDPHTFLPQYLHQDTIMSNVSNQFGTYNYSQLENDFMSDNRTPIDNHVTPHTRANGPFLPRAPHGLSEIEPSYSHEFQQSPFQPLSRPLNTPGRGPAPNFGSDARFQPDGFQNSMAPIDTDVPNPEWLHSNPPTRPGTVPSSPVMGRKRKSDAMMDQNGIVALHRGPNSPINPKSHSRKQSRVSNVKTEPRQEPTPNSLEDSEDSDIDAEAESDDDIPTSSRTTTPPSQTHRRRPGKTDSKITTASTSARKRRKMSNTDSPASKAVTNTSRARPKASTRTSSSATTSQQANAARRHPLSIDQKKANHTSSEQRRRDAAARAAARVYDLVAGIRRSSQKPNQTIRLMRANELLEHLLSARATLEAGLDGGLDTGMGMSTVAGAPGNNLMVDGETEGDVAAADVLTEMGMGMGMGVGPGGGGYFEDGFLES